MGSNPKYIKSPGDYNRYTDYTFVDFWNQNKNNYKFSRVKALEILKRFANLVHEEMLTNPDGFRLPSRVGTLIIYGVETDCKDMKRSTKDKRFELRNLNTNRIVFSPGFIFGQSRGNHSGAILWKFKSTVPLRQKMKQKIDEGNFRHWFVLKRKGDLPRYDIPPEIKRKK
jgi:tricorn protease-like protein